MKKGLILIALTLIVWACKKEITTPNGGIFRGKFEMMGLNGGGFETGNCTLAIYEKEMIFALSVDTSATFPLNTSGKFQIIDATQMNFEAKQTLPFGYTNPHVFLDSVYTYTFDDNFFELIKVIDTIEYKYQFIRY